MVAMESSRNSSLDLPSPTRPPSNTEGDANLERDLVLLLSKLDYFRARLADRQVVQKPTLALQILLSMLDELTGFTEHTLKSLKDNQAGREELLRAGELYIAIQEVLKEFAPKVLHSVLSFFGGQPVDHDQRSHALGEVTRRFVDVLNSFFVLFQGFFRESWSNAEWIQAYRLFLVDLEPAISGLKC